MLAPRASSSTLIAAWRWGVVGADVGGSWLALHVLLDRESDDTAERTIFAARAIAQLVVLMKIENRADVMSGAARVGFTLLSWATIV